MSGMWLVTIVCLTISGVSAQESSSSTCLTSRFEGIANHTACLSKSSSATNRLGTLNRATKNRIVNLHNELRATVDASNMQKMVWDGDLAAIAKKWTDSCVWDHDKRRGVPGKFTAGQNLGLGFNNWTELILAWYDEKKDFTYNSQETTGVVGHFTQLMWATSARIGCAWTHCNNLQFGGVILACNYAPAGNTHWWRPWEVREDGEVCGDCPDTCDNNGLCDCRGKVCLNGGTLDLNTCECTCSQSFHVGPECDLNCDLAQDSSFCGQFLQSQCNSGFVQHNCPHKCGVCPHADFRLHTESIQESSMMTTTTTTSPTTTTTTPTTTTTTATPTTPSTTTTPTTTTTTTTPTTTTETTTTPSVTTTTTPTTTTTTPTTTTSITTTPTTTAPMSTATTTTASITTRTVSTAASTTTAFEVDVIDKTKPTTTPTPNPPKSAATTTNSVKDTSSTDPSAETATTVQKPTDARTTSPIIKSTTTTTTTTTTEAIGTKARPGRKDRRQTRRNRRKNSKANTGYTTGNRKANTGYTTGNRKANTGYTTGNSKANTGYGSRGKQTKGRRRYRGYITSTYSTSTTPFETTSTTTATTTSVITTKPEPTTSATTIATTETTTEAANPVVVPVTIASTESPWITSSQSPKEKVDELPSVKTETDNQSDTETEDSSANQPSTTPSLEDVINQLPPGVRGTLKAVIRPGATSGRYSGQGQRRGRKRNGRRSQLRRKSPRRG